MLEYWAYVYILCLAYIHLFCVKLYIKNVLLSLTLALLNKIGDTWATWRRAIINFKSSP